MRDAGNKDCGMGAAAGAGVGVRSGGRGNFDIGSDGGGGGGGITASPAGLGGVSPCGSGKGGNVAPVAGVRTGVGGNMRPVTECTSPTGGKLLEVAPGAGGGSSAGPCIGEASGNIGSGGGGGDNVPVVSPPVSCTPDGFVIADADGSAGFMLGPDIDGADVGAPAMPVPVVPAVGGTFQPFGCDAVPELPGPNAGCAW